MWSKETTLASKYDSVHIVFFVFDNKITRELLSLLEGCVSPGERYAMTYCSLFIDFITFLLMKVKIFLKKGNSSDPP